MESGEAYLILFDVSKSPANDSDVRTTRMIYESRYVSSLSLLSRGKQSERDSGFDKIGRFEGVLTASITSSPS